MTGDLISREALKSKIDFIFPYDPLSNYEEIIGEVTKIIDNAPTVEERQQGEWIKYNFKDFGAFGDYDYKCSNCQKVSGGQYNFCSNCGADMRGGKKNDRK